MSKVQIGFVGAGRFANEVHYPNLVEFPDVHLAAVCDRNEQVLGAVADKYSIEHKFTDVGSMLDEVDLDAVFVCLPPHHLFDVAAECLKRGLHLFTEKPPGVSAEQTRGLARLAEASGSLTMVGFNRRFMPALVEARRIVESRGPIRHCATNYYKYYIADVPYYDGPASMLIIDGIHAVDTLRWLGGEVISAASITGTWHTGYPNSFRALVRFRSGCTGTLSADWAAGRRLQTVEVHSEGISVFVDVDRAVVVYADDREEPEVIEVTEIAGSNDFRILYGFRDQDRYFVDCVKNGTLPMTSLTDAVRTMELAELIERGEL
jgi:predicted dehydrogenase